MRPSSEKRHAKRISAPDALVFAMVAASAVDRKITAEELARIDAIVHELPVFRGYDADWMSGAAQECGKLLAKPGGVDEAIDLIKRGLPERLRETAYLLAAEVAAADLEHHESEIEFLTMLASALGLDALVCAALTRAARARHEKP
jgi:tellurite resistance protein